MKLKPWREIITSHGTVLQGTFRPSTFASVFSGLAFVVYFPFRGKS